MIDQFTIDRIIETANIVDVVQEYISIKKRGANFLGLCPFHNEKTPSFTVSPSKGIYKCFGCGKGGNSVNFIMEHEKLNYVEALKTLARKYHIDIVEKEPTEQDLIIENERESMLILSDFANEYFVDILHNNEEGKNVGLSYFRERGFREDIIEKFQLGYSPSTKNTFTNHAKSKGYKLEYLVKTGLTIQKDVWTTDRFGDRILFPIHNLSGRVIAFGGRTLKSDKKVAKYLNSPESEIYSKSKVLYGLFFAKKSILSNDNCFLVEGYTDVISLHQAGIENVVASSGTALTSDQIRLIKRFTNNITVLYDGDEAGIKASLRGIDLILEQGLNVKALLFPAGEDPDSYARKMNATELSHFIENNQKDFIAFKTDLLLEETKTDPIKRAGLIQDVVRSIAIIPDRIVRQVYIKECSVRLEMAEQIINAEVNKVKRQKDEAVQKRQFLEQKQKELPYKAPEKFKKDGEFTVSEKALIRLLVGYGNSILFEAQNDEEEDVSVAEFLISEINADELTMHNKLYEQILRKYEDKLLKNIPVDEKYFINHTDPQISSEVINLIANKYSLSEIWKKNKTNIVTEEKVLKKLVPETILDFKGKKIKEIIRVNNEKIKAASEAKDNDKVNQLMTVFRDLKKMEQEIAKRLNERTIL